MSFIAPGFLVAAVAAACGVIALHFLVTRRPQSVVFPTARFVPDVPIAARSRSIQLSDLLLLIIRVLIIMLAGAALARPVFPPHRERIVRVIAADVSGSVASVAETRDSVRALFRAGDALITFDTTARPVATPDSIVIASRAAGPGSLSTGLVAALRAGSHVRDGADSVELVIISPVTSAELDRATAAIRKQWPGRARLVHVTVAPAAVVPAGAPAGTRSPAFLSASRPAFSVARRRVDTVGAVVARGNVIVAPFERRWRFTADSLVHARVVARWVDGEPAAIQRDSASTCVQSVAVPMDSSGDMLLRPSVIRFRAALAAPCRNEPSTSDTAFANTLIGNGSLARTAHFPPWTGIDSPLAPWLAALAVALAIVEMVLRRAKAGEGDR
ncbi:MAG: BatA domain-containing protein [Gemmatimonadaceae bacterium]